MDEKLTDSLKLEKTEIESNTSKEETTDSTNKTKPCEGCYGASHYECRFCAHF